MSSISFPLRVPSLTGTEEEKAHQAVGFELRLRQAVADGDPVAKWALEVMDLQKAWIAELADPTSETNRPVMQPWKPSPPALGSLLEDTARELFVAEVGTVGDARRIKQYADHAWSAAKIFVEAKP